MTRVKRGSVAIKRRKKVIQFTKGFKGSHSTLFRTANQQEMKALRYSYIDGRNRKRAFRKLWIRRINASSRSYGIPYNQLIHGLKKAQIGLNRKVLSQLAVLDPVSFDQIVTNSLSL